MSCFNKKIKKLVSKDIVTEEKCICSDKLKAKEYVKNLDLKVVNIPKVIDILGKEIVPEKIDFTKYNYPMMLKCNHGCKFNVLCRTIKNVNKKNIKYLNNCIKMNFSKVNGEFQYYNIDRKIFIEEFLPIEMTIKFHCFHGNPMFVEIFKMSFLNPICCNEYDINFNKFEFTNALKRYDLTPRVPSYPKLVEDTKKLCQNFDYVRVDYYIDVLKRIWFSEFTFSPAAGNLHFINRKMDQYFGSLI